MARSIVIVESPAKARTIEKYLGKEYVVRACAGHIKDLPKRALGVDIKNDFRPTYRVITGKEKIVRELRQTAERCAAIYLAADPDREGEAICQHLAEELDDRSSRPMYRVLFNEITKPAVLEAFKQPGRVDSNKVSAQQARRILDRLVGYKVSPLLWRKVRKGLSAGRVQSVALRLIVDREKEIRAFVTEEYWNISARLRALKPPSFIAKAVKYAGKKFKVSNQEEADRILAELRAAEFSVTGVERKEKRRRPVPPFITSKLQQEAYRKLRFPVSKTMSVAQRLYEGVEVGDEGLVGLITYMRTDSTRVAQSALQEAREFIQVAFGDAYLPAKAVVYQGRKEAQDAHEAIRPTSALRTPEQVKPFLGRDELRLYELIWKRFLASQMNPALFDQSEIEIQAGRTEFKAVGSVLKFDGFLKLYQEGSDDVAPENGEAVLPEVKVGETLHVEELIPEQKFTQPPPRYTESTLVKALEERGIGRPSTYAQILSVIMLREYVLKQEGRFVPTEIGEIVVGLLVDHFREIFDYDYTARMEQNLDEIERGRLGWLAALQQFYAEFSKELQQARVGMKDLRKEEASAGVACSKCGAPMVIRLGRFGKFMACSNFPDCRNTREIPQEGAAAEVESVGSVASDETCAKCGRPMVLRKGRFGEFLSCSGYPECRTTQRTRNAPEPATGAAGPELDQACPKCGGALAVRRGRYGDFTACTRYPDCRYVKQETTGVVCPTCGKGELLQRKSKRGKVFYGCSAYPACRFVLWRRPVNETCPSCSGAYLVERSTKQGAAMLQCPDPKCGYRTKPAE